MHQTLGHCIIDLTQSTAQHFYKKGLVCTLHSQALTEYTAPILYVCLAARVLAGQNKASLLCLAKRSLQDLGHNVVTSHSHTDDDGASAVSADRLHQWS